MTTGEVRTTVGLAANDHDLEGILALQRANLEATLADRRDGFVTVVHTLPILRAMHAQLPSVVAHADGKVVATAPRWACTPASAHSTFGPCHARSLRAHERVGFDSYDAEMDATKDGVGRRSRRVSAGAKTESR